MRRVIFPPPANHPACNAKAPQTAEDADCLGSAFYAVSSECSPKASLKPSAHDMTIFSPAFPEVHFAKYVICNQARSTKTCNTNNTACCLVPDKTTSVTICKSLYLNCPRIHPQHLQERPSLGPSMQPVSQSRLLEQKGLCWLQAEKQVKQYNRPSTKSKAYSSASGWVVACPYSCHAFRQACRLEHRLHMPGTTYESTTTSLLQHARHNMPQIHCVRS